MCKAGITVVSLSLTLLLNLSPGMGSRTDQGGSVV